MELAGDQIDRQIDDRKSDWPPRQRLDTPSLDRWDVVARDRPANDAIGKGEAGTSRQRLHLDRNVGKLTVATALPLEPRVLLRPAADRLFVGDSGGSAGDGQIVAIAQSVHRNLQMDVALSPQHHFLSIGVLLQLEGRVLFDELADGASELDVVGALFGGDGEAENRLWAFRPPQAGGLAGWGQHLAGGGLVDAGQPDRFACVRWR